MKTLLQLPNYWYVKVTEESKEKLRLWLFRNSLDTCPKDLMSPFVGRIEIDFNIIGDFQFTNEGNVKGEEITFEDFRRLVLGEDIKVNEVTVVKTWETILFKTENTMVELTLNHEKKTFDLQTAREEAVSFKSDTLETAREKLKCIEQAINYAEKALNQ